jgi:hypothetical protein
LKRSTAGRPVGEALDEAADAIRHELEWWGYNVPTRPVLEVLAIKSIACYVRRLES